VACPDYLILRSARRARLEGRKIIVQPTVKTGSCRLVFARQMAQRDLDLAATRLRQITRRA
jgi:hypothetical protein